MRINIIKRSKKFDQIILLYRIFVETSLSVSDDNSCILVYVKINRNLIFNKIFLILPKKI